MNPILKKKSFEDINRQFEEHFGASPEWNSFAPGRINLIGEHTDYNQGWVLPAAIHYGIYMAWSVNHTKEVQIAARDFGETTSFKIDKVDKSESGHWSNYLKGIFIEMSEGIRTGLNCLIISDLPIGSGLSSSAALECAFARGLQLASPREWSDWDLVKAANRVENNYLGINSGILDQFASMFGKTGQAVLLDCRDRSFSHISCDLDPYQFVLINSLVKHNHATSGYNTRVSECKEALNQIQKHHPHISSLRDINLSELAEIRPALSETSWKRAIYICDENQRVLSFCDALKSRNFAGMGTLLYQSHDGLSTMYEVSCRELDLLVDLTRPFPEIIGSRMMGGGFGGCAILLIHQNHKAQILPQITRSYREETGIEAEVYEVVISDGAFHSRL